MVLPLLRLRAITSLVSSEFTGVIIKHNFSIANNLYARKTCMKHCNLSRFISSFSRPHIMDNNIPNRMEKRHSSSNKVPDPSNQQPVEKVNVNPGGEAVSKVQMLKKAVAEYGSTVIIFHVTISLMSLGMCYVLVSSGLDASEVFLTLGLAENKIASNTGTFVAAYAIHKVMAPIRISITLGATPLIVRYLRNKGILKK